MTKQQGNRRTSVVLGFGFLVVAIVLFGVAFYLFDGMSLVDSILSGDPVVSDDAPVSNGGSTTTPQEPEEPDLTLPEGMPEAFALRVWQEQIDSQSNIERLVSGDVTSIEITSTAIDGDTAVLGIVASFTDGPSVSGEMGMARYGDKWYFEYVRGLRGSADTSDRTPLPDLADVDVDLLNTIISEQAASSEVMEEYANGTVTRVDIEEIVEGPDTITLKLEMEETHEDGYGEVVLISRTVDGNKYWFMARFTKTQGES